MDSDKSLLKRTPRTPIFLSRSNSSLLPPPPPNNIKISRIKTTTLGQLNLNPEPVLLGDGLPCEQGVFEDTSDCDENKLQKNIDIFLKALNIDDNSMRNKVRKWVTNENWSYNEDIGQLLAPAKQFDEWKIMALWSGFYMSHRIQKEMAIVLCNAEEIISTEQTKLKVNYLKNSAPPDDILWNLATCCRDMKNSKVAEMGYAFGRNISIAFVTRNFKQTFELQNSNTTREFEVAILISLDELLNREKQFSKTYVYDTEFPLILDLLNDKISQGEDENMTLKVSVINLPDFTSNIPKESHASNFIPSLFKHWEERPPGAKAEFVQQVHNQVCIPLEEKTREKNRNIKFICSIEEDEWLMNKIKDKSYTLFPRDTTAKGGKRKKNTKKHKKTKKKKRTRRKRKKKKTNKRRYYK